jgi:hypothetical protein
MIYISHEYVFVYKNLQSLIVKFKWSYICVFLSPRKFRNVCYRTNTKGWENDKKICSLFLFEVLATSENTQYICFIYTFWGSIVGTEVVQLQKKFFLRIQCVYYVWYSGRIVKPNQKWYFWRFVCLKIVFFVIFTQICPPPKKRKIWMSDITFLYFSFHEIKDIC